MTTFESMVSYIYIYIPRQGILGLIILKDQNTLMLTKYFSNTQNADVMQIFINSNGEQLYR